MTKLTSATPKPANKHNNVRGFLSRLRKDQAGNTLVIMAAAIIPLIGLVGGAVDMGRVYSVRTKLQSACDAGALTGRRVMGIGLWTLANGTKPGEVAANQIFTSNFPTGFLGTTGLVKSFTEANGRVTGTASVTIPVTLMKILGAGTQAASVTCDSEMRIPHSDVMFVLDVTGSMNDSPNDDDSSNPDTVPKIEGLQIATKCFYEALSKENIADVTNVQCGRAAADNPAGNLSNLVQLRFGFVPYANNVNVRGVLPSSFFANTHDYQSREPVSSVVQTWTLAPEVKGNYTAWSNTLPMPATPTTFPTNSAAVGSFAAQITAVGATNALRTTYCNGRIAPLTLPSTTDNNPAGNSSTLLITQADNAVAYAAPVHPSTTPVISRNYTDTQTRTVTAYKYVFNGSSSTPRCILRYGQNTNSRTRTATGTQAVTWTPYNEITGWRYKQVNLNVAGLKNGTDFNSSVQLPLNEAPLTINKSGSSNNSIKVIANKTVSWPGCLEELATFKNTDDTELDDWNPIPTAALDMNIDNIPIAGNGSTLWKFALPGAVWGRKTPSNYATTNDVIGTVSTASYSLNTSCPSVSALRLNRYSAMAGTTALQTPLNFQNYVNSLAAGGRTYHDIGLLWGARLLSAEGMFAADNATTTGGEAIQRHMVLMTDGSPSYAPDDYGPHGINFWDRRQTIMSGDVTNVYSGNNATNLTDAGIGRTEALCKAIKGKNITLWVVYYGVSTASTKTLMQNCATDQGHFFQATSSAALAQQFNTIARAISELRLVSS